MVETVNVHYGRLHMSEQFEKGKPKPNKRKNKTNNALIGESLCNPYKSEYVKDIIRIPILVV